MTFSVCVDSQYKTHDGHPPTAVRDAIVNSQLSVHWILHQTVFRAPLHWTSDKQGIRLDTLVHGILAFHTSIEYPLYFQFVLYS
jgi:hypothetical protein